MIKIAVINLGKNLISAFSLNQEYPLATTLRTDNKMSQREIENILKIRFHSQRTEYKKKGILIPRLDRHGSRDGGWKFIFMDSSIVWNNLQNRQNPQPKSVEIVNEVGLKIERQVPLQKVADITSKTLEQMYIAEEKDGAFTFTPLEGNVIAESDIPHYISLCKKDK